MFTCRLLQFYRLWKSFFVIRLNGNLTTLNAENPVIYAGLEIWSSAFRITWACLHWYSQEWYLFRWTNSKINLINLNSLLVKILFPHKDDTAILLFLSKKRKKKPSQRRHLSNSSASSEDASETGSFFQMINFFFSNSTSRFFVRGIKLNISRYYLRISCNE